MNATADFSEFEQLADLFQKLASPVRLALLSELADQPCCVHELVDVLGISQPLVSQHLRILREANLVKAGRRGREKVYSLTDEHVTTIVRDGQSHVHESHAQEAPAGGAENDDAPCAADEAKPQH